MIPDKPVLLYFIHLDTSFTDIDETILKKEYKVVKFHFTIQRKMDVPLLLIRQLAFLIRYKAWQRQVTLFSMFAGYHSILPTLLKRFGSSRHFVVAGGIDSVYFPEMGYGNYRKTMLRACTAYTFRNASAIFPISHYLVKSEYRYANIEQKKQGILHLYHPVKTPLRVIYNGFKTERWFYDENEPRTEATFLTIAVNIQNEGRAKVKGVDLIVEAAAKRPQYRFTIVGADQVMGNIPLPSNITVKPFIPHHELRSIYCAHSVYLQMSMSEGFGNTLAEAMLCGCLPIGSNAGAVPEVIGDAGAILATRSIDGFLELLDRYAGPIDTRQRQQARMRILSAFSIEKRAEALLHAMHEVSGNPVSSMHE